MAREFTLRCCGVDAQSGGANFDVELAFDYGKGQIDSFTTEHPALFEGAGLRNGVAVVGRIDQIKSFYLPDQYGGGIEVKAGLGRCVAMVYTGDVQRQTRSLTSLPL